MLILTDKIRAAALPRALAYAVVAVAAMGVTCFAADGEGLFEALYGREVRQVQATPVKDDDVALARQLLGGAQTAVPQKAFLIDLCNAAYDLAKGDPAGYPVAIEAMHYLAEKVPESAGPARHKLIPIYRQQYDLAAPGQKMAVAQALVDAAQQVAAAQLQAMDMDDAAETLRTAASVADAQALPQRDSLKNALAVAQHRQAALEKARALRSRLNLNPNAPDAAAVRQELFILCMMDLDSPALAEQVAQGATDVRLTHLVRVATGSVQPAGAGDWYELARWYYKESEQVAPAVRPTVLARARQYFQRYLDGHSTPDLPRAKAVLAMRKLEQSGAAAAIIAPGPAKVNGVLDTPGGATSTAQTPNTPVGPDPFAADGPWLNLIDKIDAQKDAEKGVWRKENGDLVMEPDVAAKLRLPVAARGSYRLRLRFTRTEGKSTIGVMLPVVANDVRLMLSGYGGAASGLGMINGKLASENETTVTPGPVENDKPHTLVVTVKVEGVDAAISILFDGKPYITWRGPHTSLAIQDTWRLRAAGAMGIGAFSSSIRFHAIELQALSDDVKLTR